MPDDTVQSGLNDNTAGALAYVTIIPAIVFLVAAPYNQNSYIRFHAWQCIFLSIGWFALCIIAVIPILGWIVFAVGAIALFIGWIMCCLLYTSRSPYNAGTATVVALPFAVGAGAWRLDSLPGWGSREEQNGE